MGSLTTADFREAGYTAGQLRSVGYGVADVRDAGYSAEQSRLAGFTAKDLRDSGETIATLKLAGFSATQLEDVGAPERPSHPHPVPRSPEYLPSISRVDMGRAMCAS